MEGPLSISVTFDLLKVGHCGHPECVVLRGGGLRAVTFPSLVGLIEHPRQGLVLYDTGYSRHFYEATRSFPECLYRAITPVKLPPEEELLTQLESRGIAASEIGTIIISHFHGDHVAGLRDFPGARFIATRAEREGNEKRGRLGRLRRAYLRRLLPDDFEGRVRYAGESPVLSMPTPWSALGKAHDLFGDGSLIGFDLPGHTASQLGLAFRSEDREVFFVGDACWKIEGLEQDRRPSSLAYGLFADGAAYDRTFAALCELRRSPQAPLIIPSHCAKTWQECGGSRRIDRA